MPPLAAAGAAIASAASAVTLTGLATGAGILSAGLQVVGMATGSKTLQKIGMGFGVASGVGFAANGARSLMSAASVTGGTSKAGGLLAKDNMDEMLSAPTKGTKNSQGLKTFNGSGAESSSMDSFNKNSKIIGGESTAASGGGMMPDMEIEKTYFQRANDTLTKYNPLMNIVGGVGEAYMVNERMDLQRELLDKRLGFDQQLVDRVNKNNGTLLNIDPALDLSRKPNAFAPLLRTQ